MVTKLYAEFVVKLYDFLVDNSLYPSHLRTKFLEQFGFSEETDVTNLLVDLL